MTRLLVPVLVAALACSMSGCAQETADEEESESSADGISTQRFEALRANLPVTKDDAQVFASEDELRTYFGTSCGWFCTEPYAGRLPFTIAQGEYVVFISRAESAPGQGFSFARMYREGNPKWQYAQTCPNGSRVPYALAKIAPGRLTIWASDKGQSSSCAAR